PCRGGWRRRGGSFPARWPGRAARRKRASGTRPRCGTAGGAPAGPFPLGGAPVRGGGGPPALCRGAPAPGWGTTRRGPRPRGGGRGGGSTAECAGPLGGGKGGDGGQRSPLLHRMPAEREEE